MSDPVDDHVEATVQAMAEMHSDHTRETTADQKMVIRLTGFLARPGLLASLLAVTMVWIAYNAAAPALAMPAFDPPPFSLLELIATIAGLFTVLLILGTQRREEEFARRRAQLTLQLAALSEQKIAKAISLIEEQRQESPFLATRHDPQAAEMAKATDPKHVLDRIIETHENEPSTDKTRG